MPRRESRPGSATRYPPLKTNRIIFSNISYDRVSDLFYSNRVSGLRRTYSKPSFFFFSIQFRTRKNLTVKTPHFERIDSTRQIIFSYGVKTLNSYRTRVGTLRATWYRHYRLIYVEYRLVKEFIRLFEKKLTALEIKILPSAIRHGRCCCKVSGEV